MRWLLSYLQSRTFCVKVCNRFGPVVETPSGVPQGSVLGPFLFAAFMGSFNFSAPNVVCVKYADDVTLIESVARNSCSTISLHDCISVFSREGLLLNTAKCKQMCIRRSLRGTHSTDCGFDKVHCTKILGVTFTESFSWKAQISDTLRLASQRLHIIRTLKAYVGKPELLCVYHAIITSLLLYASPAYGKLSAALLEKLQRFQNRAHRLICEGSSCDCSDFPALRGRLEVAAVNLMQRSEANPNHPLHQYVPERLPATRKLRLPSCKTTRRLNSFFVWGALLLNSS